jgi:hypothetical protein
MLRADGLGLPHSLPASRQVLLELRLGGRQRLPETDHAGYLQARIANPRSEIIEVAALLLVLGQFALPRLQGVEAVLRGQADLVIERPRTDGCGVEAEGPRTAALLPAVRLHPPCIDRKAGGSQAEVPCERSSCDHGGLP